MKYMVKIEQVNHCYVEVEADDCQEAMREVGRELFRNDVEHHYIMGEAYVKDVDVLDG